ncbi:MAG: HU family DNA-binding protein [Bacteroidetes bacterium]|nr:HU family DNA-binding protein [Bacteroidota bacterium]MCY4205012.1 HU family DNA-binding protein [Bacteroidota bacterium]
MTKAKLIESIARKTGLTKKETTAAFLAFWETIEEALVRGESVELRGYASFRVHHQAARKVRNPATGDSMHLEARKVPVFKPSKELKDRIKNSTQE